MNRLLFAKEGCAVWISHLDLMRVFQRAFRRAGLLLHHSQGYTPHAYVSILLPLSVGVRSRCEILDYALAPEQPQLPPEEIQARLNAALPEGIRVLEVYESSKKAGKLAYLQAALHLEYDNGGAGSHSEAILQLLQQSPLMMQKRTKRGEAEVDLAPMVRQVTLRQQTEQELVIEVRVCAQNPSLNPQLLADAIFQYLPEHAPDFIRLERQEIFDIDGAVFR